MQILVLPFGSFGDVHPFVGLAQALRARGHDVLVGVNAYFRPLIDRLGLPYHEMEKAELYLQTTRDPDLWHPTRAFRTVFEKGVAMGMRLQYELIAERRRQGDLLVVNNCLGLGARVAHEKFGVPLLTIHLQPGVLWSEHESPALGGMLVGPGVPRWAKRFQYWLGETFFIDTIACPIVNGFRAELGLPPIRKMTRFWHSPESNLCLFPEWFAPRQPDWPAPLHLTSFPLWDEAPIHDADPELECFLQAGSPPIVFTPGSGNCQAREFFATAVAACRLLGRRGLLLTRFPEQVPDKLPPEVRFFAYAPFSQLLPRVAALVHHGGIGTTAQALYAGIPQLIMPLAHDQFDNAARVCRLGVGDQIKVKAFLPEAVAAKLRRLLDVPAVQERCQATAQRFAGVTPFAEACAEVERLAERRGMSKKKAMPA